MRTYRQILRDHRIETDRLREKQMLEIEAVSRGTANGDVESIPQAEPVWVVLPTGDPSNESKRWVAIRISEIVSIVDGSYREEKEWPSSVVTDTNKDEWFIRLSPLDIMAIIRGEIPFKESDGQ